MRYVMGPKFGLKPRTTADSPAQHPGGKADHKPDVYFDEGAETLTASITRHDPEAEVAPAQILVFLVPTGTMDVEPTAEGLVRSSYDRTTTPLPDAPEEGAAPVEIDLPIPARDEEVSYAGFVVFAYAE